MKSCEMSWKLMELNMQETKQLTSGLMKGFSFVKNVLLTNSLLIWQAANKDWQAINQGNLVTKHHDLKN